MSEKEEIFLFEPYLKETLWGNRHLLDAKKIKNFPSDVKIGESWEISAVPSHVSKLKHNSNRNLNDLLKEDKIGLLGKKNAEKYDDFPLLIKFISTSDVLSLQVHPDDVMAKRFKSFGKTEMWYIMEADENAYVIDGFREDTDLNLLNKDSLRKAIEEQTFDLYLNKISVKKGDVIFVPAGKIHAIGPNITLAEIQQSSDITYRLFDWNRLDKNGKSRELHLELGLEAIKPELYHKEISYAILQDQVSHLIANEKFTTNLIEVKNGFVRDLKMIDSFVIYLCLEGEVSINGEKISAYESLLLKATCPLAHIKPLTKSTKLLETYIVEI